MNNETIKGLLDVWAIANRTTTVSLVNEPFIRRSYTHQRADDIQFVCIYKKKNSWWPFSESFYLQSVKIFHKTDLIEHLNFVEPAVLESNIDWCADLSDVKFTDSEWTTISDLRERAI